MIARKYRPVDAEQVQEIYDRCHMGHFALPKLDFVLSSVVIEHHDKIIGYGALERILEGILIIDDDVSLKNRVLALDDIIDSGRVASKLNGYDRFYVFPSPNTFADLLTKHFNFKPCDPIFRIEF